MKETVNHPDHYGGAENPYEAIKVIRAWGLNFALGNAVKYIARAGKKDPAKHIEDLQKAVFYLQNEIASLQGAQSESLQSSFVGKNSIYTQEQFSALVEKIKNLPDNKKTHIKDHLLNIAKECLNSKISAHLAMVNLADFLYIDIESRFLNCEK
jgi:ribosomal protein S15P/S13E